MWFIFVSWQNRVYKFDSEELFESNLRQWKTTLQNQPKGFLITGKADTKHTFIQPNAGYFKEEPI